MWFLHTALWLLSSSILLIALLLNDGRKMDQLRASIQQSFNDCEKGITGSENSRSIELSPYNEASFLSRAAKSITQPSENVPSGTREGMLEETPLALSVRQLRWRQFKGLIFRLYLLKRKHLIVTTLELLIPLTIVLLLYWPKYELQPVAVEESFFTDPRYSRCLFGFYGPRVNADFRSLGLNEKYIRKNLELSLTLEEAFCQNYSSADISQFQNGAKDSADANMAAYLQSVGRNVELFPMLPHREYDGTTLLTLPERMHGRLLYLLNTEKGNCSRLKQTFEFVLESLLGRSRVDPYCRCTASEHQYSDKSCCSSFYNHTDYPTILLIDDPHHEALSPQTKLPLFAVIVCQLTDYENWSFQFDIRLDRVDESIGPTSKNFIQYDHRLYVHDFLEPMHYVAGIVKPPRQDYPGGFLDVQSIIHYHIVHHYSQAKQNLHSALDKVNGDANQKVGGGDYLSVEEQSLIYGEETAQMLMAKYWPPEDGRVLSSHWSWYLTVLIRDICAVCNAHRLFFRTTKHQEWCKQLPSQLQAAFVSRKAYGWVSMALTVILSMSPTSGGLGKGESSVCAEWRIRELMSGVPLTDLQRVAISGILVGVLNDWRKLTSRELRKEFVPIRFLENGMPIKRGVYNSFVALLMPILSFIWISVFVCPTWILTKSLAKDRTTRTEEYLRIMGVSEYILWLSWFGFYFAFYSIISCILAVAAVPLFADTNIILLAILFLLTSLCTLSYSILLTRVLSNGNTAASVGVVLYLIMYLVFVMIELSGFLLKPYVKYLAMLLYPVGLAYGTTILLAFTISSPSDLSRDLRSQLRGTYYGISMMSVFTMIALDVVLYFLLGYYIGQVNPGQYGIPRPWNFCLRWSFWCPDKYRKSMCKKAVATKRRIKIIRSCRQKDQSIKSRKNVCCLNGQLTPQDQRDKQAADDIDDSFVSAVLSRTNADKSFSGTSKSRVIRPSSRPPVIIEVRKLRKEFPSPAATTITDAAMCWRRSTGIKGKKKATVAVDDVSFRVYSGELIVLLGRNGAGKSTLINLMTGMIRPTSGSVKVDGFNIAEEPGKTRERLGYCLQQDVLFDELTVEEHLVFYGLLKGLSSEMLEKEIKHVISQFGLAAKRFSAAGNLSGGQRRCLSVGISLLGNPKLVFLDEPASGLDLVARKDLWEMLKTVKAGRAIIVTTHQMNEVDDIADRTLIMHQGHIAALGTSLYLKSIIGGSGYSLKIFIEYPGNQYESRVMVDEAVTNFVLNRVPNAQIVKNFGSQLQFRIPFHDVTRLIELLEYIECQILRYTRETQRPNSSLVMSYLWHQHPLVYVKDFILSLPTLEDVFLAVSEIHDRHDEHSQPQKQVLSNLDEPMHVIEVESKRLSSSSIRGRAPESNEHPNAIDCRPMECSPSSNSQYMKSIFDQFVDLFNDSQQASRSPFNKFVSTIFALLLYKVDTSCSDLLGFGCQLLLPVLLVLLTTTLTFAVVRLSSVPVLLHTDLLRSWPYAKLLPQRVHVGGEGLDTFFDYCDPNWNMIHTPNITSARQMDHWLGDNPSQHSYSALYRFSNNPDVDWALFYNTSFSHVIPMSINMLLECQLRAKAPHHRARFRIRNHPLPRRPKYTNFVVQGLVTIWTTIGVSIIPAMSTPLDNRQLKHLFHLSGVNVFQYWISVYMWDLATFLISDALILFVLQAYQVELVDRNHVVPFFVTTLLFGVAMHAFIYFFSLICRSRGALRLLTVVLGLSCPIIIPIIRFPSSTNRIWELWVKYVVLWIPNISITQAFYDLVSRSKNHRTSKENWSLVMVPLAFLASTGVALFSLVLLLDSYSSHGLIYSILRKSHRSIGFLLGQRLDHFGSPGNCDDRDVFREYQILKRQRQASAPLSGKGTATCNTESALTHPNLKNITIRIGDQRQASDNNSERTEDASGVSVYETSRDNSSPTSEGEATPICCTTCETTSSGYDSEDEEDVEREILGASIQLLGLNKRYGCQCIWCCRSVDVLNHIWSSIPSGRCFGLLGCNGSGKSTIMKILSSELLATSGTAIINNVDVTNNPSRVWPSMGVCPQSDFMANGLTAEQYARLFYRLHGVKGDKLNQLTLAFLRLIGLADVRNERLRNLSGGNRRRFAVGLSILRCPKILILDEPTCGMDPASRHRFWNIIAWFSEGWRRSSYSEGDQQSTVLLTSHSMSECEALCHRVAVLSSGDIRAIGSISHLKSRYADIYELHVEINGDDRRFNSHLSTMFPDVRLLSRFGSYYVYGVPITGIPISKLMRVVLGEKARYNINFFAVSHVSLESVFIQLQNLFCNRRTNYA